MKATVTDVTVLLCPFSVPTHVTEQRAVPMATATPPKPDEYVPPCISTRSFYLSEIPAETLLEMCEDFKQEVFKRAGKIDPSKTSHGAN